MGGYFKRARGLSAKENNVMRARPDAAKGEWIYAKNYGENVVTQAGSLRRLTSLPDFLEPM